MYNILFLPSWYPTRENPLRGSFFREQALALSKNYNFSVLHFNFYEINFINYLWKYINHITFKIQVDSDLSLTDVTLDIYNPKLGTFFTFLFKCLRLRKFVATSLEMLSTKTKKSAFAKLLKYIDKPDLLYGVTAQTIAETAKELANYYNIPYILSEHSPFPVIGTVINDKTKKAIEECNNFISISNDKTRQILMQNININPVLIGNMIDGNSFFIKNNNKQNRKFTILITAAYNFYKDYPTFFSAIKLLSTITESSFKVLIVGFAPIPNINIWSLGSEAFINLLKQYDIQHLCELYPKVERMKMNDLYNNADVFVMTSIQEGFPVSVLEAAACGLPIYSTRCGGVEDFVGKSCGRIFNLKDYNSLAYELKKLIEKKVTYNPQLIRTKVLKKYGTEAFLKNISTVFDKTIVDFNNKINYYSEKEI